MRTYAATELIRQQADWRFLDGIHAALRPDGASQDRAERIVLPRIEAIIGAN